MNVRINLVLSIFPLEKQHLAIIRNFEDGLILQTIHYPNEIRDITNTPNLPSNENYPIQKQELTAAINLIHHLTNPFEKEMYTDEYKEALTELIENKIEQQEKPKQSLQLQTSSILWRHYRQVLNKQK